MKFHGVSPMARSVLIMVMCAPLLACELLAGIESRPFQPGGGGGQAPAATSASTSSGGSGGGIGGHCNTCDAAPPRETYRDLVIEDAPLAYWRFDDAPGTLEVHDEVTGGPYGEVVPGVTFGEPSVSPQLDPALFLADGSIELPYNDLDFGTASYTIELWIHPTAVDDGYRFAFGKGGPLGGYSLYLHVFNNDTPTLQVNRTRAELLPVDAVSYTRASIVGGWQHWVAVYDADRHVLALFVDGALEKITPTDVDTVASDAVFAWGRLSSIGGQSLEAYIDEAAVYGRPLSCESICAHYQAGVAP